jgi:hypothetical protein
MSDDPAKRHFNSILAEWVLKIALIFFMASLFFSSTARQFAEEYGISSSIMVYIKLGVIIVYGLIISVLERGMFKLIAFSTIIVGAVYKIILVISMDKFMLVDFIDLSDEILLVAVSVYYLYRHHRHEKKLKKKKKPAPTL